jgi:hypothetical protein
VHAWVGACVGGCTRGHVHAWVGARVGTCTRGWVHAWVGACVGGCTRGWVHAWVSEWVGGCTRGWVGGCVSGDNIITHATPQQPGHTNNSNAITPQPQCSCYSREGDRSGESSTVPALQSISMWVRYAYARLPRRQKGPLGTACRECTGSGSAAHVAVVPPRLLKWQQMWQQCRM